MLMVVVNMSRTGLKGSLSKVEGFNRCIVWQRNANSINFKGKIYQRMTRLVMMYLAEAWTVMRKDRGRVTEENRNKEKAVMDTWSFDEGWEKKWDHQKDAGTTFSQSRSFCGNWQNTRGQNRTEGYVMRREDESYMKIITAEVTGCCWCGEQNKKWETWYNKTWSLSNWIKEDPGDRDKCKSRISVADHSAGRD